MNAAPQAPYLPLSRDYKVLSSESTPEGLRVTAEVLGVPTECPFCQSRELGKWGTRPLVCLDLPFKGKSVAFHITVKRYRCKRCEQSFSQALPEISETRSMTRRLLLWIGQEGQVRTFVSIAADIGANEKTVRNAFKDFVKLLEKAVHIKTPTHMALLEVTAVHKPRVAVLNMQARTLVDLLEKPEKVALAGYLSQLADAYTVQYASVGLSSVVHEAASSNLPQAVVFIDRPYVLALVAAELLRARAGLRSKVSKALLLKAEAALSPAEWNRLVDAFTRCHGLEEAYRFKEALQEAYSGSPAPEQVAERIDALLAGLSGEVRPWFSAFAGAWERWRGPMLNFFKPGASEASVEQLGDLAPIGAAIDSYGRGYAFEALRCKLLFPPSIPAITCSSPGTVLDQIRKADREKC